MSDSLKKENFFKEALNLLKKINKLKIEDNEILNSFYYEGYNIWQMYQQSLFLELKSYTRYKTFEKHKGLTVKAFFGSLLALKISIFSFLIDLIRRPKILIYSRDKVNDVYQNDFRLGDMYKYLYQNNLSYTEYFHSILNRKFLINFTKRKRPAFFLEAIDFLHYILSSLGIFNKISIDLEKIDLSDIEERDKDFVADLLVRYGKLVNRSIFKVKVFKFFISLIKPKAVFAIDDSWHYFELILAAKFTGVPFYAFQHGNITKYHVGWLKAEGVEGSLVKPDRLYVWSDYWAKELQRLNSYYKENEIFVSGLNSRQNSSIEKQKPDTPGMVRALIPYETHAPKDEVLEYMDNINKCSDIEVFFKPRADRDLSEQLNNFGLKSDTKILQGTPAEVASKTDVVLGTYSTFLSDMVSLGVPTAMLMTSFDYGQALVDNGLVEPLRLNDPLCQKVKDFAQTSKEILADRKNKLMGTQSFTLLDTFENLIKELEIKND